jgi:hypothetical protein
MEGWKGKGGNQEDLASEIKPASCCWGAGFGYADSLDREKAVSGGLIN